MINPYQQAADEIGWTVQTVLGRPDLCSLGDTCEYCRSRHELHVAVRKLNSDMDGAPIYACATLCYPCDVNGRNWEIMFGSDGLSERRVRHAAHVAGRTSPPEQRRQVRGQQGR